MRINEELAEAGIDAEQRESLFRVEPLRVEVLSERKGPADVTSPSVIVTYFAVFLLFGLLAIYGQWVAQGIVEEKQSRVVEVLLSSALEACECYFQAFQFVVWSGSSARDALSNVLFDTQGTC